MELTHRFRHGRATQLNYVFDLAVVIRSTKLISLSPAISERGQLNRGLCHDWAQAVHAIRYSPFSRKSTIKSDAVSHR